MRAVAETVLERFQDQVALDFGDRATDQVAGNLFGGNGRLRCDVGVVFLVEPHSVRRKNAINSDLGSG